MKSQANSVDPTDLVRNWPLSSAATLGSSVRAAGLFLEVRARLPMAARKSLSIKARELTLRLPESSVDAFSDSSAIVSRTLEGIESLPVIPREIEDILGISTTERHRWLADGRLPSAGTRTVHLRGRARKITFHVFDPHLVEDVLDRGLVDAWREEDALRAAENRRRAAWKAKLVRDAKRRPATKGSDRAGSRPNLVGWEEFEREGLLRSTPSGR
jgi:hypothetical protein